MPSPRALTVLALGFLPLPQDPPPHSSPRPPAESGEVVITASAFEQDPLDAPFSISTVETDRLRLARTLPEALARTPGVMVQKTAHGQSSPFIRGFTGFRNLLLVDGVRLNHMAMRSGPNQYWSTVDTYGVERLEVVRGPSSVLYGSDAIGGTVNAITRRAQRGAPGSGVSIGGGLYSRFASAEGSTAGRGEVSIASGDEWGVLAGYSAFAFSDLRAGSDIGNLPNTAYTQAGGDLRIDRYLDNGVELTFALQSFRQQNVPRTERTVWAKSYASTAVGSELVRDHDQIRDLAYARARWSGHGGLLDAGEITLSMHHHDEERNRLRTGLRRDMQGFSLIDYGLTARFESPMGETGRWSWGFEGHLETLNSYRVNSVGGVAAVPPPVQGPVGDNASGTALAAYLQLEQSLGDVTLIPGLRLTHNAIDADRVANLTPIGPPQIAVADRWTALTGSLRGNWFVAEETAVFGGVSQGFRTPSLHDLTSLDATSGFEVPNPGLEPEYYLQAEIGAKGESGGFTWQASLFRTWIRNQIVASPTGAFVGPTPVVSKSNVGDGWLNGFEIDLAYQATTELSLYASGFATKGEVDQLIPGTGVPFKMPITRLAPLQGTAGVRWQHEGTGPWVEAWVWSSDKQDRFAFRDYTDTRRIPPGGTPGFTVFGLSSGWPIDDGVTVGLALENLASKDYRVHGSGVNGPGFNAVATLELVF